MCELKAYVRKGEREELVLEAVSNVRTEGDEVILRNLFGEEKRVRATVREISLSKSQIILDQT